MQTSFKDKMKDIWQRRRKAIIKGGIAVVIFVVVVGSFFFITHGSIEDHRFCALCHEEQYSYSDYRPMPATRVFSGLGVGCAECHPQPFAEYKKSKHYRGRSGFRPGCVSCHGTPHSIGDFAEYMFLSGPILFGQPGKGPGGTFFEYTSPMQDKEKWEKVRRAWANKVRKWFLETDSRTCRNCHDIERIVKYPNPKKPWAAQIMKKAVLEQGKTCIECHYNIVHAPVPWDPKLVEEVKQTSKTTSRKNKSG